MTGDAAVTGSWAALITAAGTSSRMNNSRKKEYLLLDGKPVILRTMESFAAAGGFGMVGITYPVGGEKAMKEIISGALYEGVLLLCEGGVTRQESVRAGLEMLAHQAPDYVLIHDGARPWISRAVITAVMESVLNYGSGAPVVPAVNALKKIDDSGYITDHLERTSVVGVQTPQGFVFRSILEAHRKAASDGFEYIDDTEIYSRYCGPVHTVPGDPENRKITYCHDIGVTS